MSFCGNKRDETKRLARRVDGDDVCQLAPPGQGLIACTGSSSKKRGLSFFTGTTGRLEKRVHYESKTESFVTDYETVQLDCGQYPSCSTNDLPTNVARWFTFADGGCTAEIAKTTVNKMNLVNLQVSSLRLAFSVSSH